MKAFKFLFLFVLLSGSIAVLNVKAQAIHEAGWTHDCSVDPIDVWGIDEIIVDGLIAYKIVSKYNKDGTLKSLHFQNKGTKLTGLSGTTYKYIDLVAQGGGWTWPEPDGGEAHFVGQMKVIALGTGKIYSPLNS